MNIIRISTILIVLVFLQACEEDKIDIEKYGSISGTILDGDDYTPLSGVMVATNPASSSTLTNDDGTFELGKVEEGEIAISAKKKDYLSNTISVSVYNNEKTTLTFFLLKDENDVGWVEIYDPVPGNGAVEQATSFTFQWTVEQENTGKELEYTVYYFKANSTVQKVAGENLTDTEVGISGLSHSTVYYWYVVAKYEGKRVANSPTWTFETAAS